MNAIHLGLLVFLFLAISDVCSETIQFVDGSSVSGVTEKRFEVDAGVTIFHESGVRYVEWTSIKKSDRKRLQNEHCLEVESQREEMVSTITDVAASLFKSSSVGESIRNHESAIWFMAGGILLLIAAAGWMFLASFFESPVWGIALVLTSGLSWLPFMFVCPKSAWAPTLAAVTGVGLILLGLW